MAPERIDLSPLSTQYPLVWALLTKPERQAQRQELFVRFTHFTYSRTSPAELDAVASALEQILAQRKTGTLRVVIPNEDLGKNPLHCMGYYSQMTPTEFRKEFIGCSSSGWSSSEGMHFEWASPKD